MILGVVLPVLWAFGVDLALPLALAAMAACSPFAVKIAFKENGATPAAWWGQLPARLRQTMTEHPGWRGRLTMVAEAPAAALAVVPRDVGDAADGWPASECGVRAMMVVGVDPAVKGSASGAV